MAESNSPNPTRDDLRQRLTEVFAEILSKKTPYFGGGGQGYYGVHLENIAEDGSEVDLVLTFKASERYCCAELGCHCDFASASYWTRIREGMNACNLREFPLPHIRIVRGVAEQGATFDPGGLKAPLSREGFTYEKGPFPPVFETGMGDIS
jgi:hypothetical protein